LKKPLTIRLPHLAGSGEDEWSKGWVRGGEVYERYSKRSLVSDFNQADSNENAAAGHG
jgi:hypothetical protein